MLAVLARPLFFFLAGRRFFALCQHGGPSPCVLVFASGLKDVCLPLMYLSQGMACIMYLFAELLVFPLGAASSHSACAAVLRPAIFCFLVCLSVFLLSSLGLLAVSSLVPSHAVA